MEYYEYELQRKCKCGLWEFVKYVNHANYPCCLVYERVVPV